MEADVNYWASVTNCIGFSVAQRELYPPKVVSTTALSRFTTLTAGKFVVNTLYGVYRMCRKLESYNVKFLLPSFAHCEPVSDEGFEGNIEALFRDLSVHDVRDKPQHK